MVKSKKNPKNPEPYFDWETYWETRKSYDEVRLSQRTVFDKSILTVSGTALGASLYLLTVFPIPNSSMAVVALVCTWAFFGVAILSNLASYLLGSESAKRDIEDLDRDTRIAKEMFEQGMKHEEPNSERNNLVNWTDRITYLSLILFFLGGISLFYFAYQLAYSGGNDVREKASTNNCSSSIIR